MEIYLGGMGMFFEPRYSLGRILGAKLTIVITFLDDTCDAYATLPEVINLAAAVQRCAFRTLDLMHLCSM